MISVHQNFVHSFHFIHSSHSAHHAFNSLYNLIFNYQNDEHTLKFFIKRCLSCTALHFKFKIIFNLYLYIICCFKNDELLNSLSEFSSLIKSFFENDMIQFKHFLNHI